MINLNETLEQFEKFLARVELISQGGEFSIDEILQNAACVQYVEDARVCNELPADDIVGPVLVLVVALLGFLVLLACTGFRLHRAHGTVFLALYLAFLVWAVAKEYQ